MSTRRWLSGLFLLWATCGDEPISYVVVPEVPAVAPSAPAIHIVLRDSDSMMPMPGRAIIYPVGMTPKPDFKSDGATASVLAPGVIGAPEGVLLVSGDATIGLPIGTYDLILLQGTEYESVRKTVSVTADAVTQVDVTLEHTVKTEGWLAADMHIHSRRSFDSKLLAAHRVVSEVVSGIQVLVPTEHGYHYDLSDLIKTLDYGSRAVSIPGSEYNFQGGHAGIYPVVFDPNGPFLGAPPWQEWPKPNMADPETYFPLVHQQAGSPLIVINHPRLPPDLGYFLNIRWRPGMPLKTAGLFDAMEVLNGYAMQPHEVAELLQDWFTLLNQGLRVTGLGNSDTHRIDWLRAGYPRTWLQFPTSEPSRVIPSDLRDALLSMRAVGSNGPFVTMSAEGKGIGDTVKVQSGNVSVSITADAPGWVDLTRLQIYRNGVLFTEIPITSRSHPALSTKVDVDVPSDGWIVALALGDAPLPTDVIGAVNAGRALPMAFTNPIWLDADGDGKVTPSSSVPPRPLPWKQSMLASDQDRAQLLELLHAPLDCEPFEYPSWLR